MSRCSTIQERRNRITNSKSPNNCLPQIIAAKMQTTNNNSWHCCQIFVPSNNITKKLQQASQFLKTIYLENRAIFGCNNPQNACEILGVLLVVSLNCFSCIFNVTSIGGYASCLLQLVFFLILLQMRNAALWGLMLVSYIPFGSITPQC